MAFKEALEEFNEVMGEDLITFVLSGLSREELKGLYEGIAIAADTNAGDMRGVYDQVTGQAIRTLVTNYLLEIHHKAYHDDKPEWCQECHPMQLDPKNDMFQRGE